MGKEENGMAFQTIRKNLGEIKGTCSVVIISWVITFIWIVLRANLSINYRLVLDMFCYAGIILALLISALMMIIQPTRKTLQRAKIALAIIVVMAFLSAIVLANASCLRKIFISTAICLFILICAYIHFRFKCWIFAKCVKRVSVQGVTGKVFSLVWKLIKEEQSSWFHEGETHMNYLLCERQAAPENEESPEAITQAMREIKDTHCGDYDCLLPDNKLDDSGYWANDDLCKDCTYGVCYRALERSLPEGKQVKRNENQRFKTTQTAMRGMPRS